MREQLCEREGEKDREHVQIQHCLVYVKAYEKATAIWREHRGHIL